jgi:hypothetical protein
MPQDWNYGTDRLGNASMGTGAEWRILSAMVVTSTIPIQLVIKPVSFIADHFLFAGHVSAPVPSARQPPLIIDARFRANQ